jgi:DNA-binding IclR family transcriptional regulator
MKSPDNAAYTIQVVSDAFKVLEALMDQSVAASITQLPQRVGLNRNKTFRLLATLCELGIAEREPVSGNYQLGAYAIALAQKLLMSSSLVSHAHPIMESLALKHDEAVYMTVPQNDQVLFLDMVDCGQQVKAAPLLGQSHPIFSNAAGKVMKAFDSRDLVEKMLSKSGKKGNVPDLEKLFSELQEIRQTGVALDCGGLGDGIITVAVGVRDYAGKVIGAITMLGPSFRMLTGRIENEIVPSLIEGAELLSEKFGYAPA